MIPFSPPLITEEDISAVVDVLRSGWITTGPKVKEFEEALKNYTKCQGVACTSSGTASLQTILRLMDIGPGDEVITSAFTYTASASVCAHVGAKIVLCDIGTDSFHLSPQELSKKITEKTKAVIAVDYAGLPCDYASIENVLNQKKHLYMPKKESLQTKFKRPIIISDGAHALGSRLDTKYVGAIGDFTAFSFHAVKNLTTGEGGSIHFNLPPETNVSDIYKQLYLLILQGQNRDALARLQGSWRYDIEFLGFKYNMMDIQAAIGLSQLKRYESILKKRKTLFDRYIQNLANISEIKLLKIPTNVDSSYHLFPIRLEGFKEKQRDSFIQKLNQAGVSSNVHFIPLPLHSAYKKIGYDIIDFPQSFSTYENLITLPLHLKLSLEDVDTICQKVVDILETE